MRVKHSTGIYASFDSFIEVSILNNNSLLSEQKEIFTVENIDACINRFVDNAKEGKRNYEDKIKEQFGDASDDVKNVFAHANWLWAMAVNDITVDGKKRAVKICMPENMTVGSNHFFGGFGSAGTYHKQNKYWEIVFNLRLIRYLKLHKPESLQSAKQMIETVCLYGKYQKPDAEKAVKEIFTLREGKELPTCAMYNILLHLSKPEFYERIASDAHKTLIVDSFDVLLDPSSFDAKNLDEKIFEIRSKLNDKNGISKDFDFYDEEKLLRIWNPWMSDSEYSEYQALKYKKSIILYGPPGTGKTFSAKSIAESFVLQEAFKQDKANLTKYFDGKLDVSDKIHRLQLHPNYSYEDFIAGTQIYQGETRPAEGYFLKLCKRIKDDADKVPHVLILDEINRIDLSRLFGEVFSAIENREEEIDLVLGNFKVIIPENIYIIGTMNEIDFSIERIDFALRRRFAWFFYGFDRSMLAQIIDSKRGTMRFKEEQLEKYINNAEKLNARIAAMDELGRQYEIGHTFFADIIEVARGFKGKPGYIEKIPVYKDKGPAQVIWNLNIKPMIEAFLGNKDKNTLQETLSDLEGIYFNVG
ncbi:ATPase associated with various cellular activities AAA_5 [Desulfofarcimen acetoxidans DSM 771]|uniref:ATPase associated with various cellular activities AAA_5 n=1 Tax=Desulfofarcimen acetoxidans (strain ATCC 49208 / DSM 771 / KCTC 5769 / VKM B-1644 / 5575) TaxID=485916 RepID=C8VZS2_DESAS|nr:AAA family ATPase [Desulfofarcimen acetoxidans]ACV63050.1 ATPase associated with various cellular activities AAA_5 [Desulfofarcimen acetoxidans DSM 771]